ncbi:MAG: carbohydrate ABC transporter permease [Planctomycetota bacterium]
MKRILRAVLYIILLFVAVLTLVPLFWLICASLKNDGDMFHYMFLSPHPTFQNFVKLFTKVPFFWYLTNSLFLAAATVIIQLFFSSLGGFALAKYQFRGQSVLMFIMLSSMMIPAQVLLAPMYELIYKFGLVDTLLGMLIPWAVSVFGIFLFRQSIQQVPDELLQAARIDGCSEFRIYWNIVMPTIRPMIGAFTLIAFMASWNSFIWPKIILHSRRNFTLPIALDQMRTIHYQEYGMLMAGTLVSILPVMIIFFVLQKEFISGLTSGAVKG